MPLQQTSGAASYDAFGGGAPVAAKYIEDFFQTWLRTGTGSSTTVTTGLNASINKSLVWTKSRSATTNHKLTDTARGVTKALSSNTTGAEVTDSQGLTAFSSTGYTIGTNTDYNNSGATYVDWQWVATPKFFDVVTFTQTGGSGTFTTFNHNLGSAPGMVLLKATGASYPWFPCYHRSLGNDQYLVLNEISAAGTFANTFSVNSTSVTVNNNLMLADGATYVAYLFAHNAGGFGLTGTDNVISCGSFTTNGSGNATVNLGYEPQWVMFKSSAGSTTNWTILDSMRGWTNNTAGFDPELSANLSAAESDAGSGNDLGNPTATGFTVINQSASVTFIYIAIRRGPMKVPTTGTSVFKPLGNAPASTDSGVGFPADMALAKAFAASQDWLISPRLTSAVLYTNSTAVEGGIFGTAGPQPFDTQDGFKRTTIGTSSYAFWAFKRAPGFMDVVCYTGTGTTTTQTHNLQAVPELIIVKRRSGIAFWQVYSATFGRNFYAFLNDTQGFASDPGNAWGTTDPTTTTFSLSPLTETNASGSTYVAYLFATCPGVSKVTNFTGTGALQTINCGFTSGARFVLIKRTDSTGNWFVWDSSRGLSSSNDPYLLLNSTAAEVTSTNWVDTTSTGFQVTAASGNDVNISGASYIALAIS